jgi:hypothetical protein
MFHKTKFPNPYGGKMRKKIVWGVIIFLILLIVCLVGITLILRFMPFLPFNGNQIDPGYIYPVEDLDIDAQTTKISWAVAIGDYAGAIELLDELIVYDPFQDNWYYQRANMWEQMTKKEHNLEKYHAYLQNAIKDLDNAITLKKTKGEYYRYRANLYWQMAATTPYHVDRVEYLRIAAENMKTGAALGTYKAYAERDIPLIYSDMDDCDTALDEAARIATSEPMRATPDSGIAYMLAEVYTCRGAFDEALEQYEVYLLRVEDCCKSEYALYLYRVGRLEEALKYIDTDLTNEPNYRGARYFTRALIEYDLGNYESAYKDALAADRNSWSFNVFTAYIDGMNALRHGNNDEAAALLEYADATLPPDYAFLHERIAVELKTLGITRQQITPSVRLSVTPVQMPSIPTFSPAELMTVYPYPTPTVYAYTPTPAGSVRNTHTPDQSMVPGPDGFSWKSYPDSGFRLLVPDAWFVAESFENPNLEEYFITEIPRSETNALITGMHVQIYRNQYDSITTAAVLQEAAALDPNVQKILLKQVYRDEDQVVYGLMVFVEDPRFPETDHAHVKARYMRFIAVPKSNSVLVVDFESPAFTWSSAWKIGEVLLENTSID